MNCRRRTINMLTNKDVSFMRESREQIRKLCEHTIVLFTEEVNGVHPGTGEELIENKTYDGITAVVKVITLEYRDSINLENSEKLCTGEVVIDIYIGELLNGVDYKDIVGFEYNDDNYTTITSYELGISEYNRIEVGGRLTK